MQNVHQRRRRGTYAFLQHLPLVGMGYRTNATHEALQYLEQHGGTAAESQEADRILYPLYGGAWGSQIGHCIPLPFVGEAFNLAGTGVGHIVGRYRAHQDQLKEQQGESQKQLEDGSGTIVPVSATTVTGDSSASPSDSASTNAAPPPPARICPSAATLAPQSNPTDTSSPR